MKNKIHLICNAHLDPVWQWRWTEGCSEAIATFRNAVEIIREYPELIFNHNEAVLYQWVQKYDKRLFNEIRDLVEKNRWFIAGGWYLQPDVNLPPFENLVRHIRYGRDYFKREFGVEPRVAYNFDSFGHPAGLPKLLRDFGYELYVHQRPEKEFLSLPDSLYLWKGCGGTSLPAYRIEIGLYHTERKNITQRLMEAVTLSLELNRDIAVFWGLGDHGGGATRIDLDSIRKFTEQEQRVDFTHSTTDRFYDSIKPLIPALPVYEGSLQRVFTGCYTSLARIKRRAVEASAAVLQAEKLAAEAEKSNSSETGFSDSLNDIWQDILFNDFHDILPGSCTEPAEQDALDLYGRAMENIRRLNMKSITEINRCAKPLLAHIPVTIFNSCPGLSTFPVEFECMSDYRPLWDGEWNLKLFDHHGNEIVCQEEQTESRLPFHRWRRKISFLARNLESGVHYFHLKPVEAHPYTEPDNYSPAHQQPPISFIVLSDTADSWGTHHWAWRDITGRFEAGQVEKIIEKGPVRTIYESVLVFNHSKIVVHRIEYDDWPIEEYKIRIQWNEMQQRLKLAISADMPNPSLIAGIPGGWEEFPADGQEHVHGTWMMLRPGNKPKPANTEAQAETDENCRYIAHNGLHGFDFDGKEVRLSVLRSAAYCHEHGFDLTNGRSHKFMDLGMHEIRLALWKGNGCQDDSQSSRHQPLDASLISEWLNAPPLVWQHLPIG